MGSSGLLGRSRALREKGLAYAECSRKWVERHSCRRDWGESADGSAHLAAGLVAIGVAALGLLLSGCQFGASYQYVSHRSPDGVDLYFKVPPKWSIFNTNQVLEAQNGKLGPTQLKQIASGEWIETMSNRPGVTAKTSIGIGKRYPTAVVETRELGGTERDGLNFSAMRSEILGTDPSPPPLASRCSTTANSPCPGASTAIKMVVNITKTSPVLTFGQVTAVDANTNYIFSVGVGCQASCWGANAGAVTSLLNSWTLKEQAP